jgi:hypothetical protein
MPNPKPPLLLLQMNHQKLKTMRRYGNQWKKKSFEQHFPLLTLPRNMGI